MSKGTGDLNIKCEVVDRMLVSETYSLEDCRWYDNQSTDKTSNYVTRSGTVNKTFTQNEYITITGSVNGYNDMGLPFSVSTSENWCFEADMQQTDYSYKIFIGMVLISTSNSSHKISNLLYTSEYASFGYGSPNSYLFRDSNVRGAINTWYHFKWTLQNGELIYQIYDNNNVLLSTHTATLPSNYNNVEVYPCITRYENTQTSRVKNIKFKPL